MKGFSLLEVIIVSAIGLVVGTFLISILVNSNGFFFKQGAVINEGVNINDTMDNLTSMIRQASAVATGYPEATPSFVTSSHVLVLKLASEGPTEIIPDTYDYVVFSTDPTNPNILRMQIFPDPQSSRKSTNQVLTTLLDNVQYKFYDKNGNQVTPVSASVVEVSLTVLAQTGQVSSQRTSKVSVTLRNM
ncbi:prepilin-type N-terminal cleavage/methylation domain-containing protein [Patescibacteria group bacterium]|nr:prepilin-type N-terminal cleavage/methylation domain-containing protein [Patescibacteria group bacterium]MCL5409942.1 prepilin-type N-terminal cleavage/methylation domain-containing protein [Patescibacteria group bacterium]